MTLAAVLSSHVTPTIRDRGREYFRSRAVTLESVGPAAVTATVYGSDAYDVDLALVGRTVSASCTCPYVDEYGAVCKHIWATVLAVESRGFAAGAAAAGSLRLVLDGDDDYDDAPPRPPFPPFWSSPPVRAGPTRETWKDQLDALRREVQPAGPDSRQHGLSAARRLVFVVDVPASAQARKLVREVNVRERKKNGEWGRRRATPD